MEGQRKIFLNKRIIDQQRKQREGEKRETMKTGNVIKTMRCSLWARSFIQNFSYSNDTLSIIGCE